jgi:hypothetical protein
MARAKNEPGLGHSRMHYDSQTGISPASHEPAMLPGFFPSTAVADLGMTYPAYGGPLPLLASDSYGPSPIGTIGPDKQPYQNRQVLQIIPTPDYKPQPERSHGPTAPSQMSKGQRDVSGQDETTTRRSRLVPKTVHPIVSPDGFQRPKSYSPLDLLMQKIQAKPDTDEIVRQTEAAILGEEERTLVAPSRTRKEATSSTSRRAKRLWLCEFSGCGKTFRQRCQLKIHNDTHTGVRRYVRSPRSTTTFSQGIF